MRPMWHGYFVKGNVLALDTLWTRARFRHMRDTQFQNVRIFLHYFQLDTLDAVKLSPETL